MSTKFSFETCFCVTWMQIFFEKQLNSRILRPTLEFCRALLGIQLLVGPVDFTYCMYTLKIVVRLKVPPSPCTPLRAPNKICKSPFIQLNSLQTLIDPTRFYRKMFQHFESSVTTYSFPSSSVQRIRIFYSTMRKNRLTTFIFI